MVQFGRWKYGDLGARGMKRGGDGLMKSANQKGGNSETLKIAVNICVAHE